jgi:hypothetical protein
MRMKPHQRHAQYRADSDCSSRRIGAPIAPLVRSACVFTFDDLAPGAPPGKSLSQAFTDALDAGL